MKSGQNLVLTPREYGACVDWDSGRVELTPPRLGEENEYGGWSLPAAARLPRGISSQFANLRDPDNKFFRQSLEKLASEYGVLGITGLPKDWAATPLYGKSQAEEVAWWVRYAQEVYDLLRLYRILKKAKENGDYDAEGAVHEVLDFVPIVRTVQRGVLNRVTDQYVVTREETRMPGVNTVWRSSGERTGQGFSDNTPPLQAAAYVLASTISRRLDGGITIGKGQVLPSKRSLIGYAITEERRTSYLLAAIYHDLWELITGAKAVEVCANTECNRLFAPQRKTKKFCSDTCRVAFNRAQKHPG